MRSAMRVFVGLSLLIGLGACSAAEPKDEPAPQRASAVTVQMFRYQPEQLTITPGTTVTWTNRDQILHTATGGVPGEPDDSFDGSMDEAGKTFTHTFRARGRFPYFCSRHEGMRGTVIVR